MVEWSSCESFPEELAALRLAWLWRLWRHFYCKDFDELIRKDEMKSSKLPRGVGSVKVSMRKRQVLSAIDSFIDQIRSLETTGAEKLRKKLGGKLMSDLRRYLGNNLQTNSISGLLKQMNAKGSLEANLPLMRTYLIDLRSRISRNPQKFLLLESVLVKKVTRNTPEEVKGKLFIHDDDKSQIRLYEKPPHLAIGGVPVSLSEVELEYLELFIVNRIFSAQSSHLFSSLKQEFNGIASRFSNHFLHLHGEMLLRDFLFGKTGAGRTKRMRFLRFSPAKTPK
jgi:hypothetical protein